MNGDPSVRHVLVVEDRESRRTIFLDDSKYTIGRHPSNTIQIGSKQISRHHATLIRKVNRQNQQYSFWILDGDLDGNKSYNGIIINGEKSLVHELKEGDLINFGCEVNASYHRISSSAETGSSDSPERTVAETSSRAIPRSEQSTLIIDRDFLHLDLENESEAAEPISVEDDTFQAQSYLDPLTQLPNAILFREYISIALTNARRKKMIVALCLVEIGSYEKVREDYGSSASDSLVLEVSKQIKAILRSTDLVARYQDNLFGILFTQIEHPKYVPHILQRLNKTLHNPMECRDRSIHITSHQGVAIYPQDGEVEDRLLVIAKEKLEQHKVKQPTGTEDDSKSSLTERLSRAEIRLKSALSKEELEMYYQPQINIKTGRISGMEALIRWNHPQQGILSPAHFWPWAEKTDLVFPLTNWIFKTTFRQLHLWQEAQFNSIALSVNLSPRQFYHPQLEDILVHCLHEENLDPGTVELEVTETTILEDTNTARTILHQLQKIGVLLSMDNFGVGHGAINYLQEFPFHKLKIDRSLIAKLEEDPKSKAMIQSLIAIAQNFKIDVVAEGVETDTQIVLLEQLNCDAIQGYQLSRPLAVNEVRNFLEKHDAKL